MDNLHFYNLGREVPDSAKKPISAGRMKNLTDINPMWRIKKLTEFFGPCGIGWYYAPIKKWMETYGEEIACFVDIELYIKVDGEWSKPIYGNGGSMFAKKEKGGIYVSDECYKMATTDAISVACKQLGIGADVYWQLDDSKYSCSESSICKDDENDTENQTYKNDIPDRLKDVVKELERTGYGKVAICKKYNIDDITKMSDLQIKDFLQKIKTVPDKKQ